MSMLYIRDKTSHKIFYVEEEYSSLIWTERYQEAGDFELEIPLKVANVNNYSVGNFLTLDDSRDSMVIESREIDDNVEEPIFRVKGRSASVLLDRRVNASRILDLYKESIEYVGDAVLVLTKMFEDELIKPILNYWAFFKRIDNGPITGSETDSDLEPGVASDGYGNYKKYTVIKMVTEEYPPERKILPIKYNFNFSESIHIDTIRYKIDTIYELLSIIAKQNYLGFRSYFNSDNDLVIEVYRGVDHSPEKKVLDPVIFNPIMDNVTRIDYFDDYSNYKNVYFSYSDGVVLFDRGTLPFLNNGFGYGGDTYISGFDRYEIPIDISDEISFASLSSDSIDTSIEGEQTTYDEAQRWDEYAIKVMNKAASVAKSKYEEGEYKTIETSEGEVDALVRYKYGEDYDIGDVVYITTMDGSIAMSAYISETVMSYDSDGIVITPNFKNMAEYEDARDDEGSVDDDEEDTDGNRPVFEW